MLHDQTIYRLLLEYTVRDVYLNWDLWKSYKPGLRVLLLLSQITLTTEIALSASDASLYHT